MYMYIPFLQCFQAHLLVFQNYHALISTIEDYSVQLHLDDPFPAVLKMSSA